MDVDDYVRSTIASIPEERRNLVTTHDAFAYFGKAYNVKIAGFVTINPSSEPSIQDRKRLAQTLRDLKIPAVFLEPNLFHVPLCCNRLRTITICRFARFMVMLLTRTCICMHR